MSQKQQSKLKNNIMKKINCRMEIASSTNIPTTNIRKLIGSINDETDLITQTKNHLENLPCVKYVDFGYEMSSSLNTISIAVGCEGATSTINASHVNKTRALDLVVGKFLTEYK